MACYIAMRNAAILCGPQWTVYEPGLDYFVDKENVRVLVDSRKKLESSL